MAHPAVFLLCLALSAPLANTVTLSRQTLQGANDSSASLDERVPFRQVMHNYLRSDVQYLADVVVGGQTLNAILDTGSFETLVLSQDCSTCGSAANMYSSEVSDTFERGYLRATHFFGSGSAECVEGFESVSVGPLVAPRLSFWEVMDADMPVLDASSIQAIVGVGPPGAPADSAWAAARADRERLRAWREKSEGLPKAVREVGTRRLATLANRSKEAALYTATRNDSLLEALNVTSFSVCYGSAQGSDGYFTWHDDATQRRGELFVKVPVVGDHTWGVRMTGVHLDGPSGTTDVLACGSGCGAIVDSGTSLLVMPSAAAEAVAQALEALRATCDQNLGVSGLPYLTFQLGNEKFALPPEAYIGTVVGEVKNSRHLRQKVVVCGLQLLVMAEEAETQFGPMWILGMPFFRQYYVNFGLGPKESRSLHMALAGPGCHPNGDLVLGQKEAMSISATGEASPEQRHFRTVDASQLRMPQWAERAFGEGSLQI